MPPDVFTDDVMSMFWENFDAELKSPVSDELELSQTRAARLESENEALKQAALAAQNQQIETEKKCKTYEQQTDEMETTVRNLQADALQAVEPTEWAPLSTADVERRMKAIEAAICHWAETHAKFTLDVVLDEFDFFTKPAVKERCLQADAVLTLWCAFAKNESIQEPGKAAAMLLSAAASNWIFKSIFDDHFFAFRGREECEDLLWEGHRSTLIALKRAMRKHYECGDEAEIWQMLRMIDPAIAEKSRKAAASHVAAAFFELHSIDTTDECMEEMLSEFTAIAEQAATLAWKLWTGKVYITVQRVGGPGEEIYDSKSEWLEPHPLHSKDLVNDPNALDGREIILSSPSVIALGMADSDNYYDETLLKKGVVWMG